MITLREQWSVLAKDKKSSKPTQPPSSHDRYPDILPYLDNCVDIGGDYINASPVTVGSNNFIVSQSPLPNTFFQWWNMVFQKSNLIIMLTNVIEDGKVKAHGYWPILNSTDFFSHENYTIYVTNLSEVNVTEHIVRRIFLVQDSTGVSKFIVQLHYKGWVDKQVPDPDEFQKLRSLCKKFNGDNSIPIIHCSAGIGRAGVFVGSFANSQNTMDVVTNLRKQRWGMIQTLAQYVYLDNLLNSQK